jgi:hypothetical protein
VRDAGPQGREERRAGRDRHLAGRTGDLTDDVLRLAAAIVADAVAFLLWDLAARTPARLARDLATGLRGPAVALRGLARFIAGSLLLACGALVLVPISIETHTFLVLETWTLVTGLLVEALIGGSRAARER